MENNQIKQILRLIVGGYLMYLAYDLYKSGQGSWLLLAAAILFALAGGILAVLSLLKLVKKENAPLPENEEET